MATSRLAPAFDLKGTVLSVTVLRLRAIDVEQIERELRLRTSQLPHFFDRAPVVVDGDLLGVAGTGLDLAALAAALRRCNLVPVGARNLPPEVAAAATAAGFGQLKEGAPGTVRGPVSRPPAEGAACEPPAGQEKDTGGHDAQDSQLPSPRPSLMVHQPVRSGRVIYAPLTDLVVVAAVNAGGEVIADGNVHVYGPLRGRALAGAGGDEQARIFTTSLGAELVSVAGCYLRAEDLPEALRGRPAQVLLREGRLTVESL